MTSSAGLNGVSTAASLLIVEDERIVALDLTLTLESLGFRVVGTASNKNEAVRLTMSYRPDLVLMDINLGSGGDGIEAAEEIARFADVPVVFLTAYADAEILRRAGQVAPYGYLIKPVRHRELNATVQMALARIRATRGRLQAERRLRLALDAAKMGVVTLNDGADLIEIDGHFPPIADRSVRTLHMPLGEFLGRLSDDTQAKVRHLLGQGGDLHVVTRWHAADASTTTRWLEVHASYFANELAIVGICRDVTKQVEQEHGLRQAAVVFESAADAILILDPHGRVITANPAFIRLTGWPIAEIRDRHPNEFLHARRNSDRQLLDDTPLDFLGHAEVRCQRYDGSNFAAWEHVAPVRDETGVVSHRVLTFTDISALRSAETQVQHLAYHDPLTGLGNRNQLRELLGALPPPTTNQDVAALLFLDLDGFKVINDSLGHDKGDALLVNMSDRLRSVLRQGDEAIRLGGDEFLLIIRPVQGADLDALLQRLLCVVREPIDLATGSSVQVSASIGIALYPSDGATPDALLRAADIAMYAAKSAGRNRFARYSPKMAEAANERLSVEQGLMQAIANGEFSLHWQPLVTLDGQTMVGAEALLRWQSETLGTINPDRFIPVAEESGLIQPLGRWVMRQALTTWAQWQRDGLVQGRLAINVSALQLQDDQFAEELARELKVTGMDPRELEIEVTETALQRVPHIEHRLSRITQLGVKVALDDFGTGYSSLSILKLLPLHRLKVDRAFVRDVVGNASDQAIVRAIVAMADALDLELIAEGVEHAGQQECLQLIGVKEAQGWLFARAMSAPDFLGWVASR